MNMHLNIDSKSVKVIALCTALFLLMSAAGYTQSGGTSNEWGGLTDPFDLPVGARSLGMGGAYVTVADDPFSLYWNPATLENVQAMSVGFYHTSLAGVTQYDYLAYVYPTINFGTFAAGILRMAVGDIENRPLDGALVGTQDMSRTMYMVGYGKKLFKWISVGTTVKIEHQIMPSYFDDANGSLGGYSEFGVGGDFGLLVTSPLSNAFLRHWHVGFNYQNAVQRTVQLADQRQASPGNFSFGLSRKFYISDGSNHFLLAYELDNPEGEDVPNYLHLGSEFGFRNTFMLRLGYDKRGETTDGYGMTYGLGVRYIGFQLDYSYWSGVDQFFGSSHRISITADIGKTRSQKVADRESEEFRRIQDEARKADEQRRKNIYFTGMAEARDHFENREYIRASNAINKVLALDDSGSDPDFQDARVLAEQINEAIMAQRNLDIQNEIARTRQELADAAKHQQVDEHYERAMDFWESEQFRDAIVECDRALELDPNHKPTQDLRTLADKDLRNKIAGLLEAASEMYKKGKAFEAIKYYREALPLAQGRPETEGFIQGRISQLNGQLDFQNLLREAADYENREQWAEAANLYQQALRSRPNNKDIQRRYQEANARANARKMEPTPEVNRLYTLGMRALRDGDYDEAINYYQQALDEQPLNETILRALDYARNQKRRAESPEETN